MSQIRSRREPGSEGSSSGIWKYLVPVSIAIIVVVIVARLLMSGTDNSTGKMWSFVTVTPSLQQSEVNIKMSGDSKKQIDTATKLYATDAGLEVKSGEASVTFEPNTSKLFLDKNVDLKYEWNLGGKQTFTLNSGCAWFEGADLETSFQMRNFTATPTGSTVAAFCQNAVASNAYVLRWEINIKAGDKTVDVGIGQKITLMNKEIWSVILSEKIDSFDSYMKESDLYMRHNGGTYSSSTGSWEILSLSGTSLLGTGSQAITETLSSASAGKGIIISYPQDESTLDKNIIDITGNISDPRIVKITFNDKDAAINIAEKTFILKWFTFKNSINDVVYKTFDKDATLVTKGTFTVYLSKKVADETENKPSVTSFPLSDKDFRIVAPGQNPYKTTDNVVRIEWRVNKGTVKYITINDFKLSKFPQFGTYWYYFANKDFGTMNNGINLYTIKYYGENDDILSTGLFTIVKEEKVEEKPVTQSGSLTGTGEEAIN